MTTPTEQDPWEAYEAAYPGVLTSVSDVDNALFIVVPDESEENPHDEGPLDSDGLTDDEYAAVFTRPAEEVPVALLAAAWTQSAPEIAATIDAPDDDRQDLQSNMPKDLKDYWLRGEGAVKVRWGTPGAFKRCVRALDEYFPGETEGLCANLYHEATGHWPGEDRGKK